MNLKIISLAGLLLILANSDCSAFDPEKGTYKVGFSSFKVYDHSRKYALGQDSISRPLLIHLWYPALENDLSLALDYKHYIDLIAQREDYEISRPDIDNFSFNYVKAYSDYAKSSFGLDTSISARQILASPVFAKGGLSLPKNDPPLPLLIYAPSNGKASVQNHMICEHLASHGFMILSVASAGPNSIKREAMEESTIAQVMDMEYILSYLVDSLHIQYSSLGVFGFSTGGNAIALFQMRNKQVGAVLSMDGSHEYSYYLKLYKMEEFDPGKMDVPYLSMVNSHEDYSIYPYYNSIASTEKTMLRMPYLDHFGFVSSWRFFESCSADPDLSKLGISYDHMSACALGFFNKYLKPCLSSEDEPKCCETSTEYIQVLDQTHASISKLCNFILDHDTVAAASYLHENKSVFLAQEDEINILAKMLQDNYVDISILLLQFNIEKHPNSWQPYYFLAQVYKNNEEPSLAKSALLKAQEFNPENTEISDLLNEITSEE